MRETAKAACKGSLSLCDERQGIALCEISDASPAGAEVRPDRVGPGAAGRQTLLNAGNDVRSMTSFNSVHGPDALSSVSYKGATARSDEQPTSSVRRGSVSRRLEVSVAADLVQDLPNHTGPVLRSIAG